jgi:hypothetical protein
MPTTDEQKSSGIKSGTYSGSSAGAALDRDLLAGAFALGFGFGDGLGARVSSSSLPTEACLQEFKLTNNIKMD